MVVYSYVIQTYLLESCFSFLLNTSRMLVSMWLAVWGLVVGAVGKSELVIINGCPMLCLQHCGGLLYEDSYVPAKDF